MGFSKSWAHVPGQETPPIYHRPIHHGVGVGFDPELGTNEKVPLTGAGAAAPAA